MIWTNVAFIAIAVPSFAILLNPRVLRTPMWRATVTPLASIIGSGFLVAAPILTHVAGRWAWVAMLGLCAAGYLFGAAIRRNIRWGEPLLAQNPPRIIARLELWSDVALAFAYFISVAFYLNLLAAFALRTGNVMDQHAIRVVSSGVIIALGAIGMARGFGTMERIETVAVGVKLAVIAGLLMTLAVALAFAAPGSASPIAVRIGEAREMRVLLGLVLLVQGFETSRYLGSEYDAGTRVRSMRFAQLIASGIYVAFIALVTAFSDGKLPDAGGETRILDIVGQVSSITGPFLIVAALASQLSAAIADMSGSGGLLAGASRKRVSMRGGFLITALVALAITWAADIYGIIAYASKAFALYYGLQCALATYVCARRADRAGRALAGLFFAGALLAAAVLVLGLPAEGSG